MTYRLGSCVVLLGAVVSKVVAAAPAAPVQTQRLEPPPLPLMVDLRKVPVGSWSEYRIAEGTHTTTVRMALVARQGQLADIETQVKAGSISGITRIMRMSVPIEDAAEVTPRDRVIQLGEDPPMSLPAESLGTPVQVFRKLDAAKRVGVEAITVPAGLFPRAEHYHDKGAAGQTFDFWISKTVMPFGLLKLASSGPGAGGVVTLELSDHGGGAKPLITRKPRPFDAAAIMSPGQPGVGAGAGDGLAAPSGPLRLIPSLHPGMPPASTMVSPPVRAGKRPAGGASLGGAGGQRPASNLTTAKPSEK